MESEPTTVRVLQDKHRLQVLQKSALMDTPPEEGFDRLTRVASLSLSVPVALVSLVDDARQFFKSQVGLTGAIADIRQTPLSHSFCKHVVATGERLIVSDARKHPLVRDNPIIAELGVIAYAGIPLITHDGVRLGSFCAIDIKPRDWTETDLQILTDLAGAVMSEISLKRAKENAEGANHSKDRFLAMLSHELRTPLSPALLISASMASDTSLPASVREDASIIQKNVQQQSRLIDDLLDVTRIENGKVSLQYGPVNLHELLPEIVATLKTDATAKKQLLIMHLTATRCHLTADAGRLRQVFSNLLKNAIKFTPLGGQVTVQTKDKDDVDSVIEVSVTDTGIGIDPAVLPRIFDAFEQGSRSITDEFSGLGLGLAITKGLVEAHDGRISAVSEGKNAGTRMVVSLPTVDATFDKPSTTPMLATNGLRSFNILLVEDHRDTLKAMSRLLRKLDHRVTAVDCMAAALTVAQGEQFDLLISDLDLPDGTGLDLMRQLSQKHSIRGIALTGYGMEEDVVNSRSAGFDAHLIKPINFSDLAAAIQNKPNN